MGRQFGEHDVGPEQEVAAVPKTTLGDEAPGRLDVGFLDEALDRASLAVAELLAETDVAVAGGGPGRGDAKRHDETGARRFGSLAAGPTEGFRIGDEMVGREDQGGGAWILPSREACGDRNGRGGIASLGLEHDVGLDADGLQLFCGDEADIMGGQDHETSESLARDTLGGRLEGRQFAYERDELLGHAFA